MGLYKPSVSNTLKKIQKKSLVTVSQLSRILHDVTPFFGLWILRFRIFLGCRCEKTAAHLSRLLHIVAAAGDHQALAQGKRSATRLRNGGGLSYDLSYLFIYIYVIIIQ